MKFWKSLWFAFKELDKKQKIIMCLYMYAILPISYYEYCKHKKLKKFS